MKRKGIALALCSAVCLALALGASAAECAHNWRIDYTKCVSPTCSKAGSTVYVCSRCADTKSEPIAATAHDYVTISGTEASCTEDGNIIEKCSVCEDVRTTKPKKLGHDFKETSRKAPACGTPGNIAYKCSRCSETKSEPITALAHDFSKFISSSATCTTAGKSTYQCSRCDELTLKSVSGLGHDYEKTGGPTCTTAGKYVNQCKRCDYSYTDTRTTKALGHDLPEADSSAWRITKKATCDAEGARRAKCARCKLYITEAIDALEHDYDSTLYLIKAPTATTSGKAQVRCENCNETITQSIAKGTTNLAKYSIPPLEVSHESDIVARGTEITMSCELPGAKIYYALDGKSPTSATYRKTYTEPITVLESVIIKAYAVFEANDDVDPTDVITLRMVVKESDPWLYLEEDASEGGYIPLESGDKFRPDDKATRYEVLEAMDPLFGSWGEDAENYFSDVSVKHADVVGKFVGAKLVDGYDDKTFRGEENIKRGELCKLLVLALGIETSKTDAAKFSDVPLTHWAYAYIAALTEEGYLKGDPDGTFRPEDPLTRAELVTVLNRIAEVDPVKAVTIADVPAKHWAYAAICAAVQ